VPAPPLLPPPQPWYFGNPVTAYQSYARGKDAQCRVYAVTRDVDLLDLSDARNLGTLLDVLPEAGKHVFQVLTGYGVTRITQRADPGLSEDCYYRNKPVHEVRLCTTGYLSPEAQRRDWHVSIEFAHTVCGLGFDGWVIGDTYRRTSGGWFHDEAMLCHPAIVLSPVANARCSAYVRQYQQMVDAVR